MKWLPSLLAAFVVVACSVDPFVPTVERVAGDYTAHFLMTNDSSAAVDWIARGGLTAGRPNRTDPDAAGRARQGSRSDA